MSQYFDHTPQGINAVNQVENLASEVEQAFTSIEDVIDKGDSVNASIGSSIGSLDNKYIRDYAKFNKSISANFQPYTQDLYFPTNSKESSLDLIPHISTAEHRAAISITNKTNPSKTYRYHHQSNLEQIGDFTIVGKKVVFYTSPDEDSDLSITYRGYNATSPDDNHEFPFDLRYNVLQITSNNEVVKKFPYTSNNSTYTITGTNFKNLCSTFIQNVSSTDLNKYVAFFLEDGTRVENVETITITTSIISFVTSDPLPPTGDISVYVANSSLGQLIECLYRLFYSHDHDLNGGNNINHGSLVGLFDSDEDGNPLIRYQTSSKKNYDHPQYFNREGFIEDEAVYNNAILGDVLLAAQTKGEGADTSNAFNHTNTDSVKLIFGSYGSGHQVYFDKLEDSLMIDSMSKHGITLSTQIGKRAVSVNDHYISDEIDSEEYSYLNIVLGTPEEGELGTLKLSRRTPTGFDDQAHLISHSSEFDIVFLKDTFKLQEGSKLSFGVPPILEIYQDGNEVTFKGLNADATVNFDSKLKVKAIEVSQINADEVRLTDTQKITYNIEAPNYQTTDYMNYEDNSLNIKATNSINFKLNGRRKGVTLDKKHHIYGAINSGLFADSATRTNLFVESEGDTYFIKSNYNWTVDSNLLEVDRGNVYAANLRPFNTEIQIDLSTNLINGVDYGNNNKMFTQNDPQQVPVLFARVPNGLDIVSAYTRPSGGAESTVTYGTIRAKRFEVPSSLTGNDSGFFGNVNIPLANSLIVNGSTTFYNAVTFAMPTSFTNAITANNLGVTNKLTTVDIESTNFGRFKDLEVTNNLSAVNQLTVNRLVQNQSSVTSSFAGPVVFNAVPTFNLESNFVGNLNANNIYSSLLETDTLRVTGTSEYEMLEVNHLRVDSSLTVDTIIQDNNVANNTFEGTVEFRNNVTMPKGTTHFIIGNDDIEDRRTTSGVLIKSDEVRLGTNGLVSAGKIIASKGEPSGNGDRIGGFAFAGTNGLPDGDTGFFAENEIEGQNGSDLVFRIDGVERGRISKVPLNMNALSHEGYEKELITFENLTTEMLAIKTTVLDSTYPVGTIYQNSMDGRDPKLILNWPMSVWRRYAIGRSLMGAEGSGPSELVDLYLDKPANLNLVGGFKYGDFTHKLTEPEMPTHTHSAGAFLQEHVEIHGSSTVGRVFRRDENDDTILTNSTGGDQPHNNTHPIIVAYIWERLS